MLVWTPSGWQWLPAVLIIWVLYEAWRAVIVSTARQRYEQQVDKFLHEHKIPNDPFRHTHRVVVREQVLSDPGLVEAMAARARDEKRPFYDIRLRVRDWLMEIVPQFNLLAYYKVGYRVGRMAAYSVYHVKLDQASLDRAQAAIPADATVVYVSNHRSNADFVVTGFMLSKSVQVSYAVGEWARVWPLENLFRSFGSYFVRRGEKDPLYHRTLEAYLQLVTKQGVTQAMFPEGGLTRDGKLRPAKVGLLDNMAKAKLDPDFRRPLVFVPVGINFDRVLEDDNMVYEHLHGVPRHRDRTTWQKTKRLVSLLWKSTGGLVLNAARFLAKRLKKHGVAAIRFGEPIVFDDWYEGQTPFLGEPDRHSRWAKLQPFADDLLARIGRVIPVTPVTLVCLAMTRIGNERFARGVDRGDLLIAMRQAADRLRDAGAAFATDDPYAPAPGERTRHIRRADVASVSLDVDTADDLDRILDMALDVMAQRHILYRRRDYRSDRWDLVEYYANSLASYAQAPNGPEDPVGTEGATKEPDQATSTATVVS